MKRKYEDTSKEEKQVSFIKNPKVFTYDYSVSEEADKKNHNSLINKSKNFYERRHMIFGFDSKYKYREALKNGELDRIDERYVVADIDKFYNNSESEKEKKLFADKVIEKRELVSKFYNL